MKELVMLVETSENKITVFFACSLVFLLGVEGKGLSYQVREGSTETIKKPNQVWKWPLVALAFFGWVGGSFAKVKQTQAQVAQPVVLPPETYNIVTVVGGGLDTGNGGQATLANLTVPSNVAFDAEGNMFIAETSTLQAPLPSPSY